MSRRLAVDPPCYPWDGSLVSPLVWVHSSSVSDRTGPVVVCFVALAPGRKLNGTRRLNGKQQISTRILTSLARRHNRAKFVLHSKCYGRFFIFRFCFTKLHLFFSIDLFKTQHCSLLATVQLHSAVSVSLEKYTVWRIL